MNTKLHAVTDADGRPMRFFMTAGQVGDHTGAAALLGSLPSADWLLADRGCDADWFREPFKNKGTVMRKLLVLANALLRDHRNWVATTV